MKAQCIASLINFNESISPGNLLKFSNDISKEGFVEYENKYEYINKINPWTISRINATTRHNLKDYMSNLFLLNPRSNKLISFWDKYCATVELDNIVLMFLGYNVSNQVSYLIIDKKSKKYVTTLFEEDLYRHRHYSNKEVMFIRCQTVEFHFLYGKEKYCYENEIWTQIELLEKFCNTVNYRLLRASYFMCPFFCVKL